MQDFTTVYHAVAMVVAIFWYWLIYVDFIQDQRRDGCDCARVPYADFVLALAVAQIVFAALSLVMRLSADLHKFAGLFLAIGAVQMLLSLLLFGAVLGYLSRVTLASCACARSWRYYVLVAVTALNALVLTVFIGVVGSNLARCGRPLCDASLWATEILKI